MIHKHNKIHFLFSMEQNKSNKWQIKSYEKLPLPPGSDLLDPSSSPTNHQDPPASNQPNQNTFHNINWNSLKSKSNLLSKLQLPTIQFPVSKTPQAPINLLSSNIAFSKQSSHCKSSNLSSKLKCKPKKHNLQSPSLKPRYDCISIFRKPDIIRK